MRIRSVTCLLVAVVCLIGSDARAEKPSVALKKKIDFGFVDTPLQDAVQFMSDTMKVKFILGRGVKKDTLVNATSKDVTLQKFLPKLLTPLKLRYRVDKDDTTITIVRRK